MTELLKRSLMHAMVRSLKNIDIGLIKPFQFNELVNGFADRNYTETEKK